MNALPAAVECGDTVIAPDAAGATYRNQPIMRRGIVHSVQPHAITLLTAQGYYTVEASKARRV